MTDLPTNPSHYRTFLLYTGYVESSASAPLVISHHFSLKETRETWQEAWEAMFLHFKGVFDIAVRSFNGIAVEGFENVRDIRYCCAKVVEDKETTFCPKCGQNLGKYRQEDIDPELLEARAFDLIEHIKSCDANGLPHEVWDLFQANGWDVPGSLQPGIVSTIYEHAEKLLGNYEETKKHSFHWEGSEARGLDKKDFWDNVHFGRYEELTRG